jgi:hypothetical protein
MVKISISDLSLMWIDSGLPTSAWRRPGTFPEALLGQFLSRPNDLVVNKLTDRPPELFCPQFSPAAQ